MLKIDQSYLLHGTEIIVSWDFNESTDNLFFWNRTSIWFWKNYTPIPCSGFIKVNVKAPLVNVRIKKLVGIKMVNVEELSIPVHPFKIVNLQQKMGFMETIDLHNSLLSSHPNSKSHFKGSNISVLSMFKKVSTNNIREERVNKDLTMQFFDDELDLEIARATVDK
jgi:hypothetical protein